jgi:uncharacterized protein YceK
MRVLLVPVLALGSGCSTIHTLSSSGEHLWLYSGTRKNLEPFQPDPFVTEDRPMGNPYRGLQQCVSIVDFPWSLVLDTVCLPVTLPLEFLAAPEGP